MVHAYNSDVEIHPGLVNKQVVLGCLKNAITDAFLRGLVYNKRVVAFYAVLFVALVTVWV